MRGLSGFWVFVVVVVLFCFVFVIAYSVVEEPSDSDQFQELPEALLRCLPSCLKGFSAG